MKFMVSTEMVLGEEPNISHYTISAEDDEGFTCGEIVLDTWDDLVAFRNALSSYLCAVDKKGGCNA